MTLAQEIADLETQAAGHKRSARYHRNQLRLTMDKITALKNRLEAAGITDGAAEGSERHGPREYSPGS